MKAFRLLGIDVYINISWLFIFFLILWSFAFGYFPQRYPQVPTSQHLMAGVVSTVLFFGSVLFHEMSHSIVARRHGVMVRRITLFIFGGVSHLERESPDPAVEVRIAAAGPLASFALGGLFLALASVGPDPRASIWSGAAAHLGMLNIALGVFNMLPGFPLDGGRVLRAWFWGRSGDRVAATRSAAAWGRALGWVLIGAGALGALSGRFVEGLWMVFIGMFLREAAGAEQRQAMMGDALAGLRVESVMAPDPVSIPQHLSVQDALHEYFLKHGFGGYPVTQDGRAVGMLSLSHLSRAAPEERERTTVARIMTPLTPDQMTWPGEDLQAAMARMSAAGVSRLPVIRSPTDALLVGLITMPAITRRVQIQEIARRH
ncbi:MAG: site-2 protease family protein [Candidatus Polarisedimenticolia bacterium]